MTNLSQQRNGGDKDASAKLEVGVQRPISGSV
jgi:hypothetical protein